MIVDMGATLWDYRYMIILLLVLGLYYLFEWQRTKTILFALMLQAKRMAKDMVLKSGKEQEEWVIKEARAVLPLPIKIIMNEDILVATVHELYHSIKKRNESWDRAV